MPGVTITDMRPDGKVLAVDLIDIFRLLGPQIEESEWEISDVECVGAGAADRLEQLADGVERVPGRTLLPLAANVAQVIDGEFIGYRNGDTDPWIRIRAVDSSAYEVESDSDAVLTRMRQGFREVSEIPGDTV